MDKIQPQIVCLIKPQVNELLTELERTIVLPQEMARDGIQLDLERLLNQAFTTFYMLEMPAAKQLIEEVLRIAYLLLEEPEVATPIMRQAVEFLVRHLDTVEDTGTEQPLLLLNEINNLRRLRAVPPVQDVTFHKELLPTPPQVSPASKRTEDFSENVRKILFQYQLALVAVLKPASRKLAFRSMIQLVLTMRDLCSEEIAEKGYWQLVEAVFRAFAENRLCWNKDRLRLLRGIDRQLGVLQDVRQSSAPLVYPPYLYRAMMGLLSLAENRDAATESLKRRLALPDKQPLDQEIESNRKLIRMNVKESTEATFAMLTYRVNNFHQTLGELAADCEGKFDRKWLCQCLMEMAKICKSIGLLAIGSCLLGHVKEVVRAIYTLGLLNEILESVLYLECITFELGNQLPTDRQLRELNRPDLDETVKRHILRSAEVITLRELRKFLSVLMNEIEKIPSDGLNGKQCETLVWGIARIGSTVAVMNMNQVLELFGCLQSAITSIQIKNRQLNILIDAVIGLDVYLEQYSWNERAGGDRRFLENSGIRLSALGV